MTVRVGMDLLWCVPGVGGSDDYLVRQLLGLAVLDHEYDVTVFAPRGFSASHPEIASAYKVVEAPSRCTSRLLRVIVQHTWLAIVSRHCDLMHFGGGTMPRTGRKRSVLTMHDIQWVDYPEYVRPLKRKYLQRSVPNSVRRANVVAVPSEFVRQTLIEHVGAAETKVVVVPHGVEATLASAPTSEKELRSRYSLGDGPIVVYPATTHPHKNHAFLIRLMADRIGDWADPLLRLVVTGSAGGAHEAVLQLIAQLNISDRVRLVGRVSADDRDGFIAMADALVFPSEYEGFGAPVIEAMAIGVPVICSDRASLPEVVDNAGIIAPLTVDAWSKVLTTARSRRGELVEAGRLRVAHFTARKSAEVLLSVYDKAMS